MSDNNAPAFPVQEDSKLHASYGMSLLDYFAGIAFGQWVRANIEGAVDDLNPSIVARESYIHARAMLAEREKQQ